MNSKTTIKDRVTLLIFYILIIIVSGCTSGTNSNIKFENRYFKYEIDKQGKNLHFIDKVSGIDYLKCDSLSYCASLISNGKKYFVNDVSFRGGILNLGFSNAGVTIGIKVKKNKNNVSFEVESVKGHVDELTFINIPLQLEGMPYEPFAACVLSMNLFTHVRELPALQSNLWASCYKRFGILGAKITMIGVPQNKILPAIRDVISKAKDIPYSDKGGAWALMQKEGYGSYLMNFGTLTEETVDEWIDRCRNLGFTQIDSHGGSNFFEFGTFELNKEMWPDGWESFKRINTRLHEAGISHIFHTYAFFIDKSSKYVTPNPSEDLGYISTFTLKEPMDDDTGELIVNESTENISTITGFHTANSVTLRIDNELIEFSGVTRSPPYKFTGLKRGANGTLPTSHQTDEIAFHMSERFGRFVPGPETALFDEMAHRHAEIVNQCKFDGIYFDAIDGSAVLGGEENFWYYGTKFIFEVVKHLERSVGMEMSSMSHHWWHYRSRWQAWDRPVRGYKRFTDIHLAAIKSGRLFLPKEIKSNEYEHGLWRGHTPLINKYAPVENGGLLLPLHLGWWGNQTWNPPQIEPTFPDDIEYLCCKMIGNNAGLSMLGGVDKQTLDKNPLFRRLTDIIRQYEELRHKNYFNDTIRSILRQPGKEFTLFQMEDSTWSFKPVAYQKHKVAGRKHPSSRWIINNEFDSQPVKLRIEPLMSVESFNDPDNIVLANFSKPHEFTNGGGAVGVSGGLLTSKEKPKCGGVSGHFFAKSTDLPQKEGSWFRIEKKFKPWLDINKNQALGVWIKGDGNEQLLNFRIESPQHLSHGAHGDHFIKIDFKGWKYFELVEIESSNYSDYIWPDSGFFVYDSYRHTVQFNNVNKLQLWYNNLPVDKEVSCLIGTIKAIPMVPVTITNPAISIGDDKLIFPVKMESGMYIEFISQNDCKLYGSKGEFIKDIDIKGSIPVLKHGENEIKYTFIDKGKVNSRAQITVISEGKPLNSLN
jgi:Carbohydrate binding domain (family 11)